MSHAEDFLFHAFQSLSEIDDDLVDHLASELSQLRYRKGRLFVLGIGGSAANASHAVNDFRKLCSIEAYAPTDNVAELTARTNDEGWESVFTGWLHISHLRAEDAVLILSVGGGDIDRNISVNLVRAARFARQCGARIYALVGRHDGAVSEHTDIQIVLPSTHIKWLTPISEAMQMVVLHCLVSNPVLQMEKTTW